jgi:hypothetical protein
LSLNLVKEKAAEVTLSLKKKGIVKVPPMRVVAVFDVSGSMNGNIRGGALQKAADQVLGVAYKFDDNGEVDVFTFDNEVRQPKSMTAEDFGSYVQREIMDKGFNTQGSTKYDRALTAVLDFLFAPKGGSKGFMGFGAKKGAVDNSLALVLFFTDGSPDGGDGSARVIQEAAAQNVYFQMIGVGRDDFSFISRLADRFDNVGMVELSGFNMSDSTIYDALVTDEFAAFLRTHGAS